MYRSFKCRSALLALVAMIALLAGSMFVEVQPASAHATDITPIIPSTPTSSTWYFAEGRVGGGFLQWLTVGNPNTSDCTVSVQYDYTLDGTTTGSTKTVTFSVSRASRHTESVNTDLGIQQNTINAATLSAVVSTPDCTGITAERPMYFTDFHGVNSGTDVFGATSAQKLWYFAEVPRGSAGESFLSVLNPNNTDASVTVSYYVGGSTPVSQTQTVKANSRGTFDPNNTSQLLSSQHMAVMVSSTQSVVVERPSYFSGIHGINGSSDVMGITSPLTTWVLAAGTTQPGSQENIIVSNISGNSITATVELMAVGGATLAPVTITIPQNSQYVFDVNSNNTFTGHTSDVSAVVTASGENTLLVQREIFNMYTGSTGWTAQGVSDAAGVAPTLNSYSFAEGFTSVNFNEWLMLANPTNVDESITVTLVNMLGETDAQTVPVPSHSRVSFDVTHMVSNSAVFSLGNVKAYAVSMTAQSVNSGPFAAERVMYWNAFGTQGSDAVAGYTGD